MPTRHTVWAAIFACLIPLAALAQSPAYPEARMQEVNARQFAPQLATLPHRLIVTPEGAATASVPFNIPPARLSPGLGLTYSSRVGDQLMGLPDGWQVAGLLEVRRDPRDLDTFWLMGGIAGRLTPAPTAAVAGHPPSATLYSLETDQTIHTVVSYVGTDDAWEVRSGNGRTWRLEPADDGAATVGATARWQVVEEWDTDRNSVRFEADQGRIERVEYGGRRGGPEKHFLCVEFAYSHTSDTRTRGGFGLLREDDHILRSVRVGRIHGIDPWELEDPGAFADAASEAWALQGEQQNLDEPAAEEPSYDSDESPPRGLDDPGGHPMDPPRDDPEGPSVFEPPEGSHDDGDCVPFREYRVVVDHRPSARLLEAVWETGYQRDPVSHLVSAISELRFEFEYTEPAGPVDNGRWNDTRPWFTELGRTESYCQFDEGPVDENYPVEAESNFWDDTCPWFGSAETIKLVDLNGDGLDDRVVSTRGGDFEVFHQLVDPNTGSRSWATESTAVSDPASNHIVERRRFDADLDGVGALFLDAERAGLHDIDNDGFVDRIYTLLAVSDPERLAGIDDSVGPAVADTDRLWVSYGSADGFESLSRPVLSPVASIQVSKVFDPELDLVDPANEDLPVVFCGTLGAGDRSEIEKHPQAFGTTSLLDWNGDGWRDIVIADGTEDHWRVWLHSGERGGGWPSAIEVEAPWLEHFEAVGQPQDSARVPEHHRFLSASFNTAWKPECGEDQEAPLPGFFTDLTDVNGDGIYDFVATWDVAGEYSDLQPQEGEWVVWLGTGGQFAEARIWSAPTPRIRAGNVESNSSHWPGGAGARFWYGQFHNKITQLDVDADGLMDLVIGNAGVDSMDAPFEGWFQNLGHGFAANAEPLPEWWNPGIDFHGNEVHRIGNTTAGGLPAWVQGDECTHPSMWNCVDIIVPLSNYEDVISGTEVVAREEFTFARVADFDHDGALDAIDLTADPTQDIREIDRAEMANRIQGFHERETSNMRFGRYPGAHLLTSVRANEARTTRTWYRSSATVWPSGDPDEEQQLAERFDLADRLFTADSMTSVQGSTTFDYEQGASRDGRLLGFGWRETVEEESFTGTLGTSRQLRVEEEFELDDVLPPALTHRTIWTPGGYAPPGTLDAGPPSGTGPRREEWHRWTQVGSFNRIRVSDRVEVTEGAEHGAGTRSWAVELEYEPGFAALTRVTLDVVGAPKLWREHRWGYHRDNGLVRILWREVEDGRGISESVRWGYDGGAPGQPAPFQHGHLSSAVIDGGWLDGGESPQQDELRWDITVGARGQVLRVDDLSSGRSEQRLWAFGSAVQTMRDDGLRGQRFDVDEQGRQTRAIDLYNGVIDETSTDALGRPHERWRTDRDGVRLLHSRWQHAVIDSTRVAVLRTFDDGGGLDGMAWFARDGSGQQTISARLGIDGDHVVARTAHDLAGRPVAVGQVERLPTLPAFDWIGGLSITAEIHRDALGEERVRYADRASGIPPTMTWNEAPGSTRTVNGDGRETAQHRDTYGRLVRVEQGGVVTGRYEWDARDRAIGYVNATGVEASWSYDVGGRLRRAVGDDFGVRTYGYAGHERSWSEDSAGLRADWVHDAWGRPTYAAFDDPSATGGLSEYRWFWDEDFQGVLGHTEDPQGRNEYRYDGFGRVSSKERSWWDGTAGAQVEYAWDVQDRQTTVLLPGGTTFEKAWVNGWAWAATVDTPNWGVADLEYRYDGQHRPAGWTTSLGHELQLTAGPAGRRASAWFGAHGESHGRTYGWNAAGALDSRVDSFTGWDSATGQPIGESHTRTYDYDSMSRLTSVTHSDAWGNQAFETWSFDDAGNLLARSMPGSAWTYSLGIGNQLLERQLSGSKSAETFAHDAAGRVEERIQGNVDWHYQYDALGRLTRIDFPDGRVVYVDRDAEGQLVRRRHIDTAGDTKSELRFGEWRHDERSGTTTEVLEGVGRLENGARRWDLREPEGHISASFDDAGQTVLRRTFYAYGDPLPDAASDTLPTDSFHGLDRDATAGVMHAGMRVYLPDDGQWLQPEPLLLEGLADANIADPQALAPYRYARNTPSGFTDRSGNAPALLPLAGAAIDGGLTAWDIHETIKTFNDPNASTFEKSLTVGLTVWGMAMPVVGGLTGIKGLLKVMTHFGDDVVSGANRVAKMGKKIKFEAPDGKVTKAVWKNRRGGGMSEQALEHEMRVTGKGDDALGLFIDDVEFDGFIPGKGLCDCKGARLAYLYNRGGFKALEGAIKQAYRQVQKADGVPIVWVFKEEAAAARFAQEIADNHKALQGAIEILVDP